jgi:hypothetical protein
VFDGDDCPHRSASGRDAFLFGGEIGVLRPRSRPCSDPEYRPAFMP